MARSKPKKRNKPRKTAHEPTTDVHYPEVVLLDNPDGQEKMSEVLIDFVEPYGDLAETLDDHRMLFELGALAWNMALLPREEREVLFSGPGGRPKSLPPNEGELFIKELVHRKERYFGDCLRMIVDVELSRDRRGGFDVHVVSTAMDFVLKERPEKRSRAWPRLFGSR